MTRVVADTHTLVWYLIDPPRLSEAAAAALDQAIAAGEPIAVSAISLVELIYLVEKGRLPREVIDRLQLALSSPDAEIVVVPLDDSVAWNLAGVPRSAIPDMPDRIIAATAVRLHATLVTCDAQIQAAGIKTVW
jgi:PIN domain nuclease of toxin-antitoxin system